LQTNKDRGAKKKGKGKKKKDGAPNKLSIGALGGVFLVGSKTNRGAFSIRSKRQTSNETTRDTPPHVTRSI